jgi:hypothetical protein
MEQVQDGFRSAGLILYFLAVAGCFFAGFAYVFFPTGHSRVLGGVLLVTSSVVMLIEMNRWVKTLPMILRYAVLMGFLTLWSGHPVGKPSETMPRAESLALLAFYGFSAALTKPLRERKLNWGDRFAVMLFVLSLAWAAGYDAYGLHAGTRSAAPNPISFLIMGVGLITLIVAWGFDRGQRRG